jgi:hypothetical protein
VFKGGQGHHGFGVPDIPPHPAALQTGRPCLRVPVCVGTRTGRRTGRNVLQAASVGNGLWALGFGQSQEPKAKILFQTEPIFGSREVEPASRPLPPLWPSSVTDEPTPRPLWFLRRNRLAPPCPRVRPGDKSPGPSHPRPVGEPTTADESIPPRPSPTTFRPHGPNSIGTPHAWPDAPEPDDPRTCPPRADAHAIDRKTPRS